MSRSIERILADTSICIVVGSGGVGKTTTSAAIAAGMAVRGHRVAVLTIDPAKRLADSLGLDDLDNAEVQVDPALFTATGADPGEGELWASMLDAKATFDELIERHAPDEESRDRILGNRIYGQISGALAGSQEYMAMEKLYEIHERGDYDLLILDTPPSRNALDFLDAPKRIVQFVDGRSLRMFIKPAGFAGRIASRGTSIVFSTLGRLTGVDLLRDLSEFFTAMSGLVDGFRERAERVQGLLSAEGTEFLIVCGPAGEPIEEAGYLREKLEDLDLPLGAVVVNRIHEGGEGASRAETTKALIGAGASKDLAGRIVTSFADRNALAERDEENIDRLSGEIGDAPLIRVPEQSDEVHDLAGLLGLGSHLFGEE